MTRRCPEKSIRRLLVWLVPILAIIPLRDMCGQDSEAVVRAKQILQATGVQGGLVVHIACGDGQLTSALRASDSYLVQGLDPDPSIVRQARKRIRAGGHYGVVSVDRLLGTRLPYVDNLVNLVVSEDLGTVPMSEVMRVLAPEG
ncbi:MAG: class I SAM-dependent methyltransferase, partial [Planctomycetaceae bacterium]